MSDYTNSLRQLADFLDKHPDLALPSEDIRVYAMDTKEEAAACLKALKPCKKEYRDNIFEISKEFGGISLRYVFLRSSVCRRKVVGTKEIEEQHIPGRTIPAHTEEIVEWECEPVMALEEATEV